MLVVPGAEVGPAFLESIEVVPFQRLDDGGGVGRAGPADRLQDLHHGCVAKIAARGRGVVVFVDHALDEPLRTLGVELEIPDKAPDTDVLGLAERPTALRAPEHTA